MESADHPRRVVALNADIVGYSRLMADDFESTSLTIADYHALVAAQVAGGGGSLANFVGDNFMALFDDAMSAIETAIAISTEIEGRNASIDESRRVRFRMGLDEGEVVRRGDDYHGDVLNIAARVQSLAPAGGIGVSGRVFRALDEPALRFHPTGSHRVKNIPEPVDIYEFSDLPSDGTDRRPKGLGMELPVLAVLPIHADDVDDSVRRLCAVVRTDLLHRLAAIPELVVIDARSDGPDVGSHGAVRYMVESGIYQTGGDVRMFIALFDVTTMNVIKSHKRTTTVDRILEVSDELSDAVARSIEIDLVVGAPAGLYAELADEEAIEKVYRGWYHLRSGTRDGWLEATRLFGEVSVSHPDLPFGHVLSAFALWMGASNEWVPDPAAGFTEARRLAQSGLQVGDPTGMAGAVEAAVLMSMGQIEEAVGVMKQVEVQRPTCDVTYGLEGSLQRYMGDYDKAIDLLDVAIRLTGITKPWYPTVKACSLFMGNRLESAADMAEEVLETQPHNLEALLVLAAAQVELGLSRRARATAERIASEFPGVDVTGWFARNPFQDEEVVARWKSDLATLGVG